MNGPSEHTAPSERSFKILKRFLPVLLLGISFAYMEASVVVYLRTIFYPEGFEFPLSGFGMTPLWRKLLFTEIGREASTLVLMLTAAGAIGRSLRERFAIFMSLFAVWDIFYYIWLKVLIDWPGSIMDWDVLFLIPVAWASPVLAPVLVSVTMLVFGVLIVYREALSKPIRVRRTDIIGFSGAVVVVIISLCTAGPHISNPDYRSHFYWSLFAVGLSAAMALFIKCWFNPSSSSAGPGFRSDRV